MKLSFFVASTAAKTALRSKQNLVLRQCCYTLTKPTQFYMNHNQNRTISNFFVAPMLQERKEKKISVTDSKEIFQRIASGEHATLTYQQGVEMLSDLAYLIVPFDKT